MIKILDFETIRTLSQRVAPSEYYDWINKCFLDKIDYQMPAKTRIGQRNGDYYAIMPALCEKKNIASVKMIGRHLLSEKDHRSTMMGDLLLYEGDTGVLKAIMDAEFITTVRTGASAAHAAILYGKSGFHTIGLIGLGNIMVACIQVLLSKITDRDLTIKLYKYHGQEKRFEEKFSNHSNVTFVYCDTYEDTIHGSEIILSGVTQVNENFCEDKYYDLGCTVIPIMTRGFQNCDLFFDRVFTDEIEQIRGFKYFNEFRSIENTTDVLQGNVFGRKNSSERILIYNYGLAIFDLFFADQFLRLSDGIIKEIPYRYCKEKFFM